MAPYRLADGIGQFRKCFGLHRDAAASRIVSRICARFFVTFDGKEYLHCRFPQQP
jgi:hypothetical protein